ncbi:hypothetical protein ACHMW6_29465 [Pseudoduganella sp. UC29_106]|uniref:hypothetical protein n=1 Tax=Pseudoduganella sp. UC29_106 TaxID=3374553 RepID=UPI003756D9E6
MSAYGPEQGLRIGSVLHIVESAQGVWLSGSNGLYHFDGKRFVQVLGQGDEPMLGLSGMIDYGDALWLNGAAGITVVARQELARALAESGYRVSFRRLDHKDGLLGAATNSFPAPSAVAGTDGKLWFTTTAGLFWLDPKAGAENRLPPPVYIRSANVDGASFALAAKGVSQLPSNPGRVQIDFTSLEFHDARAYAVPVPAGRRGPWLAAGRRLAYRNLHRPGPGQLYLQGARRQQ